ncbi:DUF6168 family protein [Psychroflexus sp. CAK57W]|uniref:DUF6168 family protein n=1 Tax=Psychroflexus curvus TaxID=2873595 RepID=UPI001CC92C07|nr:DUF6168 family protein [Psychroflexus curvus]MBZ9787067.1 DUF6168 family protein [Psychroflexus curvus]
MKKSFQNPYIPILIFSLVVFLIHWGLDSALSIITYYSISSIYLFHVISALAVAGIIHLVYVNSKDYAGYAFMGTSLLKMLAAILFLLPGFLSEEKPSFANILNFFVPYFLFLIFEAIQVIKLINPKEEN